MTPTRNWRGFARRPVAFVPQLDGIVFTRRDDIDVWEKRVDVFGSEQPGGLMTRLMGKNMMRHDGAAHQTQRQAMQPLSRRAPFSVTGAPPSAPQLPTFWMTRHRAGWPISAPITRCPCRARRCG